MSALYRILDQMTFSTLLALESMIRKNSSHKVLKQLHRFSSKDSLSGVKKCSQTSK